MKRLLLLSLVIVLSACSNTGTFKFDGLYEDIGGKETLNKVYGVAVARIYNDPEIGHFFKGVPKKHIREQLVNQTCELIGGPCVYDGMSMLEAHKDQNISERHFYILVDYVRGAMKDVGLTPQQENMIIQKLAPMKSQVVYQ